MKTAYLLPLLLLIAGCADDPKAQPTPDDPQRLTMVCDMPLRITKYPFNYVVDIKATHEVSNAERSKINGQIWVNHSGIDDTWTKCQTIKAPFIDWPEGETRNIRCTAESLDTELPLRNVNRVVFVPDGANRQDAVDFCTPPGPVDQTPRDRQEYVNYTW